MEEQLSEAKSKNDSLSREINELNATKAKLTSENGEKHQCNINKIDFNMLSVRYTEYGLGAHP